jgi:hypothetical protein
MNMEKVKVYIIESERGWGQKIDEVKEFNSADDAEKYIKDFNADNNKPVVPDWYMYATLERPFFL